MNDEATQYVFLLPTPLMAYCDGCGLWCASYEGYRAKRDDQIFCKTCTRKIAPHLTLCDKNGART